MPQKINTWKTSNYFVTKAFNFHQEATTRIFNSDGKAIGIFDLKTGKAKLSDARINEIRSHFPPEYKDVPIIGIEETNLNN